MEQLRELEKRVLDVIQKNKELQEQVAILKAEKQNLQEQCQQLEGSLLNQNKSAKTLETEKVAIKTTIEDLLKTINSLNAK